MLSVLGVQAVQAQPGGFGPQIKSTVINADNTVTFNYQNNNAKC